MNPPRAKKTHTLTWRFAVPKSALVNDLHQIFWTGSLIMGVVNLTPDSFSDGGRSLEDGVEHALLLERQGAHILDLGAESTRPGAEPISVETELSRLIPVLREVKKRSSVLISIDTRRAEVAQIALEEGAHLINDVSGLNDPKMVEVCANAGVPVVIMHMAGQPATMQQHAHYQNVLLEVRDFLFQQADMALERGIPSVVLDPGIGFGKTLEHNLALLRGIPELLERGHPVLIGASRKAMIGTLAATGAATGAGVPKADQRDAGSIALHLGAIQHGAAIIRVHDVAGHAQALAVWDKVWGDRWGDT
jgi:dihydropteroate synthase